MTINAIAIASVGAASAYFRDEMKMNALGEYLSAESQKEAPRWVGQLAPMLGLRAGQNVTQDDFRALLAKLHPQTGEELRQRAASENERVGTDFTMAAPKGFSLLEMNDESGELRKAFQASVSYAVSMIEDRAMVRVREKGANHDEHTRQLICAIFTHFTARPEEVALPNGERGLFPDPHIHAHCVIPNITWDQKTESFKAIQLGEVHAVLPMIEAAFHAHLCDKVQQLGYEIERQGKFWDVKGFSEKTIDHYSNRRNQAKAKSAEEGTRVDSGETAKSKLDMPLNEWQDIQNARLDQVGRDELLDVEKTRAAYTETGFQPLAPLTPHQAIDQACAHVFERDDSTHGHKILEQALRLGYGSITYDQVKKAYDERVDLVSAKRDKGVLVTHLNVYKENRTLLNRIAEQRGQYQPISTLAYEPKQSIKNGGEFDLSEDQLNAIHTVLHSRDLIVGIQGFAGTGKTTVFGELVPAMEKLSGHRVHMFAETTRALTEIQNAGKEFHCHSMNNAKTLAKLMTSSKVQDQIKPGDHILVDEASFIGTEMGKKLVDLAQAKEARLIFSGDKLQHFGVKRGEVFNLLQKHNVMDVALLDDIKRQKNQPYLNAVKMAANGHGFMSMMMFKELGWVKELEDNEARHEAVVTRFQEMKREGASSVVIVPTHKEGQAITQAIRSSLNFDEQQARSITLLKDKSLTDEQKQDKAQYSQKDVLVIESSIGPFAKGNRCQIVKAYDDHVLVRAEGEPPSAPVTTLPFEFSRFWSVNTQEEIRMNVGEVVKTNRQFEDVNDKSIQRGVHGTIKSFKAGADGSLNVVVQSHEGDVFLVDGDSGVLNYGYTSTSHASQGMTCDHVIVTQSLEGSAGAIDAREVYVAASRGRHSCHFFIDDFDSQIKYFLDDRLGDDAIDIVEQGDRVTPEPEPEPREITSKHYDDAVLDIFAALDRGQLIVEEGDRVQFCSFHDEHLETLDNALAWGQYQQYRGEISTVKAARQDARKADNDKTREHHYELWLDSEFEKALREQRKADDARQPETPHEYEYQGEQGFDGEPLETPPDVDDMPPVDLYDDIEAMQEALSEQFEPASNAQFINPFDDYQEDYEHDLADWLEADYQQQEQQEQQHDYRQFDV